MSSRYEEYESGIQLVVKEYWALQKLNPQHELLKLIEVKGGSHLTSGEEFTEKYPCDMDNILSRCGALCRYEADLREAVKKELERKLEQEGLLEIVRTYF